MIELGRRQKLQVVKKVEFGVYLGEKADAKEQERVLLPAKQVPAETKVGDELEVFIYRDSADRLIATTRVPALELHQTAVVKVAEVGKIGAFLDWGLEKDLLLPYKEQTVKVKKDQEVLVALYIDKSDRLCATMKVYHMLRTDSPYQKDDRVQGIIYDTSEEFDVFVAVDNCYSARIPKKDVIGTMKVGDVVEARVTAVKEDGKLDLSVRRKIPEQMEGDAEYILQSIRRRGGSLPFTDKSDPEQIKRELGMSKAAFKRAVGRLLKQGKIEIQASRIVEK